MFLLPLFEMLLLVIYSIPLFRLKERGWVAVVADALYSYVIPFSMTALLFMRTTSPLRSCLFILLLLLVGIRNILEHQIVDHDNDLRSFTPTIATHHGTIFTSSLSYLILQPLECITFLSLIFFSGKDFLPLFYGLILFLCLHIFKALLKGRLLHGRWTTRSLVTSFGTNSFNERWLPVILLALIASRYPRFWWLMLLHSVLFYPQAISIISDARYYLIRVLSIIRNVSSLKSSADSKSNIIANKGPVNT